MSDDDLLAGLGEHDRRGLAQLISRAARGDRLDELRSKLGAPAKQAKVVALTGAGGVGKSSLVGKLIEQFRSQGKSVAALAFDPHSPLTRGGGGGGRLPHPAT